MSLLRAAPLGVAMLLLLAALIRKGATSEEAGRRLGRREGELRGEPPRGGERSPAASTPPDPVPETQAPWPAFQRKLGELARTREQAGYREAVLAETAKFLDFDRSTALAFDSTRQVVQVELERIQRDMGRAFSTYPVDLPDCELQRIQVELRQRYEEERQIALARLEVFLGGGEHHRLFREFLEAWTMDVCRGEP
ncbi:MAG: hypothetical protein HY293_09235 [Planctomycetes bacterium]|nr:hypothetical protein [Planctomycetota bacterium]